VAGIGFGVLIGAGWSMLSTPKRLGDGTVKRGGSPYVAPSGAGTYVGLDGRDEMDPRHNHNPASWDQPPKPKDPGDPNKNNENNFNRNRRGSDGTPRPLPIPKPRPALNPADLIFRPLFEAMTGAAGIGNTDSNGEQRESTITEDTSGLYVNVDGQLVRVPGVDPGSGCVSGRTPLGNWISTCGSSGDPGSAEFVGKRNLPGKPKAWSKFQVLVTGRAYEEEWRINGERTQADGGPLPFVVEAKWFGRNNAAFESSPYHPSNYFNEATFVDQARRLLALNRELGSGGVRYAVSNEAGANYVRAVLREWFSDEFENGTLRVYYVPGDGM
jgi:hypothetical protein